MDRRLHLGHDRAPETVGPLSSARVPGHEAIGFRHYSTLRDVIDLALFADEAHRKMEEEKWHDDS